MSALFCIVDDHQPDLGRPVDGHCGLLRRLARLAVAVGHSLFGRRVSRCNVFCRIEDIEHVLQRQHKALGFGFCYQLL